MHENKERNDSILIFHNGGIMTVSFGDKYVCWHKDLALIMSILQLLNKVSILGAEGFGTKLTTAEIHRTYYSRFSFEMNRDSKFLVE